jgi:hypothetical protein
MTLSFSGSSIVRYLLPSVLLNLTFSRADAHTSLRVTCHPMKESMYRGSEVDPELGLELELELKLELGSVGALDRLCEVFADDIAKR